MSTIERKIYFFRADAGVNEAGIPNEYDPTIECGQIDALQVADKYLFEENGHRLFVWIDRVQTPTRLRIARLRQDDLPQLEQRGNLSGLPIPTSASVADITHVVLFENNIVGMEFNFHGPRISALRSYLKAKVKSKVWFAALLHPDVGSKLSKIKQLTLFTLKMKASKADTIKKMNKGVFGMMDAAKKAGKAEDIEVILRGDPRNKEWLDKGLLAFAKKFLRLSDPLDKASKFIVAGKDEDYKDVEVNLLNSLLLSKKNVTKLEENTRAVEANSIYKMIEAARKDLKDEIEQAAQIGFDEGT